MYILGSHYKVNDKAELYEKIVSVKLLVIVIIVSSTSLVPYIWFIARYLNVSYVASLKLKIYSQPLLN